MKLNIKPLQQTTEFGCLATSFSMVKSYLFGSSTFDQDKETLLTSEAFRSETYFNEHVYLKKLSELGCEVKVFIETPYMFESYQQLNTKYDCNIPIEHTLIGIADYEDLLQKGYVIITLIDLWSLDMIIHFPHYVVIHGFDQHHVYLLDPKYGREIRFSKEAFLKSLEEIKTRLAYSGVIFAIKRKE